MGKLIHIPRRSARPRSILVQAVVRLDGHAHWIPAGTASPTTDACGRQLLCIRLEALPSDRRLYLPLQDVLALAGEPEPVQSADALEQSGPIHSCRPAPREAP